MNRLSQMSQIINIAAAVIRDDEGRILLVRKRGTSAFMQPGGKLEAEETAEDCLLRGLSEELKVQVGLHELQPMGTHSAIAANEKDATVVASLFRIDSRVEFEVSAEIAEAIWYNPAHPAEVHLAPLTGAVVIPMLAVT